MRVLIVEDERGVAQILTNTREVHMKQLPFVSASVLAFSVASVAQTAAKRKPAKKPAASMTPEVLKVKTAEKEAEPGKKTEPVKRSEPPAST